MSVKAMSLVWDMLCPQVFGELEFKPYHKFIVVAYADHADHNGKNIYPAVETIARKTGYHERSVQRITHETEQMGIMVPDGVGPRGTNKWFLPYSERGDKIAPLTNYQGDKNVQSLGAIPSGGILTPELTEQDIYISLLEKNFDSCIWWEKFQKEIQNGQFQIKGREMIITGLGLRAEVLAERYKNYIKRALVVSKDLETITFME
jgi:Helix-turn-helix domain